MSDMVADSGAQAVQYGHRVMLCEYMTAAKNNGENLAKAFANLTTTLWGADFASNCFYDTECLINDPSRLVLRHRSLVLLVLFFFLFLFFLLLLVLSSLSHCSTVQHALCACFFCFLQVAAHFSCVAVAEVLPNGVPANCARREQHPLAGQASWHATGDCALHSLTLHLASLHESY